MRQMFEYQRQKDRLTKELFRRIGYTNTLYKIFRFGEIIKGTHQLFPVSQALLIKNIQQHQPELGDGKYATGAIDVLGAFGIVRRAGPRIVLTERGRALAAITQQRWYESVKRLYFLRVVLESDGDYVLNLLHMIPGTPVGSSYAKQLGVNFFQKILVSLGRRRSEVEACFPRGWVQQSALQHLGRVEGNIRYEILKEPKPRASQTLESKLKDLRTSRRRRNGKATLGPSSTLRHTVDPRKGWLLDLGLVCESPGRTYELTPSGANLLQKIRRDRFINDGALTIPFSVPLVRALQLDVDSPVSSDYFHQLAVGTYFDSRVTKYECDSGLLFSDLKSFYPLVKLRKFNQAETIALYECVALKVARNGILLTADDYHDCVSRVLREFEGEVYKVSGRRGAHGFLAMRA